MKKPLLVCGMLLILLSIILVLTRNRSRKSKKERFDIISDLFGGVDPADLPDYLRGISSNPEQTNELAAAEASANEDSTNTAEASDSDIAAFNNLKASAYEKGKQLFLTPEQIYGDSIPKPSGLITKEEKDNICNAVNKSFTSQQLNALKNNERTVTDMLTAFQCPSNSSSTIDTSQNSQTCLLINNHIAKNDVYMNTASLLLKCELPNVNIVNFEGKCLDTQGNTNGDLLFTTCKNSFPPDICNSMLTSARNDLASYTTERDTAKANMDYANKQLQDWTSTYNSCMTPTNADGDGGCWGEYFNDITNNIASYRSQYEQFKQQYETLSEKVNQAQAYVSGINCSERTDNQVFNYMPYDYTVKSLLNSSNAVPVSAQEILSLRTTIADLQPKVSSWYDVWKMANDSYTQCIQPCPEGGDCYNNGLYCDYDWINTLYRQQDDAWNQYQTLNTQLQTALTKLASAESNMCLTQNGAMQQVKLSQCNNSASQQLKVSTDLGQIRSLDQSLSLQSLGLSTVVQIRYGYGQLLTVPAWPPYKGQQLIWANPGSYPWYQQVFKRGSNNNLSAYYEPLTLCAGPDLIGDIILWDDCSSHAFYQDTNKNFMYYNIPGNWNRCVDYRNFNGVMYANMGSTCSWAFIEPPPDRLVSDKAQFGINSMTFRMKPIGLTPAVWVENWIQGKGVPADLGLSVDDLFYAINNTEDRSQFYFLKANKTEFWVRAPFDEERFLGYVSGAKVGYLFRDGRWDVFKRFVTNQGMPLEWTCNWFTREGGVLDSLKKQAAGTSDDTIMNELINGLILEGTQISIMVADRSEIYGGQGGNLNVDSNANGFIGATITKGSRNDGPINSIRFIKKTDAPLKSKQVNSPCWEDGFGGPRYVGCPPVEKTPIRGEWGGTNRYSDSIDVNVYGPNGPKCNYVLNSRGDVMPEYTNCRYEYASTDELWALTNRINTISGQYNMYNTWVMGGLMKFPDPSKNYINKVGFGSNEAGVYASSAQPFRWSCPGPSQYIDTVYTRSDGGARVLNAIQVQCSKRKVVIGYVDDNHVGLLKTPEGDWIEIKAMFTLIGNCPKMSAGEGFAFPDKENKSNKEGFAFPQREGFSCSWYAPWDCATDLYNTMKNYGETAYGWVKDNAGNLFGSVKAFVLNSWETVSSWASGLGNNFYNWARNAGATFVQTMITIGNGIADGAKAGFSFVANNIGTFIVNLGKDIFDGLKRFINILADVAEIVKDTIMGFINKLTNSLGIVWDIIKTIMAYLVTFALKGKQCMFLKYAKTEPYKAIRYLVFILANPIYATRNPTIGKLTGITYLFNKKLEKKEMIFPGMRQPIKEMCKNFVEQTFGAIPYLGPVVKLGVTIMMLPPTTWWVDWKIDREIFIPMFDWKREEVLMIVTPIFDTTLSWSCNTLYDLKDKIVDRLKSSFSSSIGDCSAGAATNSGTQCGAMDSDVKKAATELFVLPRACYNNV